MYFLILFWLFSLISSLAYILTLSHTHYASEYSTLVELDSLHRVVPPPPSVQLADSPEYEVDAILDSNIVCNKLYYLVYWLGYPSSDHTWEHVPCGV